MRYRSYQSPWGSVNSGYARMLLIVLVLDFESRRGDILNLFAKKKEKESICLERLAWVGTMRCVSTREEIAEVLPR